MARKPKAIVENTPEITEVNPEVELVVEPEVEETPVEVEPVIVEEPAPAPAPAPAVEAVVAKVLHDEGHKNLAQYPSIVKDGFVYAGSKERRGLVNHYFTKGNETRVIAQKM